MDFKELVRSLATLSRIGLKEGEDAKLGKEIESILGYVSQINDAAGGEIKPAPGLLRNVLREDTNPTPGGTYTEALLREAPHTEDGYVRVKKIL